MLLVTIFILALDEGIIQIDQAEVMKPDWKDVIHQNVKCR